MVFHWSLSDSKSSQVSRTLISILVDFSNAVVISTCFLISKFSSPFNNPLMTVLKAPITIGIIITFMFHCFFNSQARFRYLSFFSLPFNFTLNSAGSLFLLIITRSGHWPRFGDPLYVKIPKEVVCLILQDRCWVGIHHFLVWKNLNFWHNSQWITLPT